MTPRGLLLALALLASTEASAHCYSVWRYPWPQRCGVAHMHKIVVKNSRYDFKIDRDDFALPGLAQADLDGGAADEPTRARLLLRAALEAYNGH
jgi:hypothetical protein